MCQYTGCAYNSISGSCIFNGDPNTCAFGRNQKKIEAARKEGVRKGLDTAKRLIEGAMTKQG